ncbi:MAG: prepilin-type N-terminal cleavage/methylation domain-containing protein [Acidobacteriia bacterium]|nr:prepilin-type N-terminal cleavage/methylation domain-containing protein [Terriglobia bacterium]
MKRRTTAGFSLIEALVVVSIICVLAAIAIPMSSSAVRTYRLSAAVAATAGAIQTTRYQAIMHGYQYQLTLTSSTLSYQVYSMVPPATTFSAVGTAVPISRPGDVTIGRTVTYQFKADGTVTETSTPPNMVFSIANSVGRSNTITVSRVGNVSVTTP